MTPTQQAALEGLVDRVLSADEIAAIEEILAERNDVAIANILNAGQPSIINVIKVEDMFEVLFNSGDYMTLKTAQLSGNPLAAVAFAVLADAKTLGPGSVDLQAESTSGLLNGLLSANLLSQTGYNALITRATSAPKAIHYNAVSDALNIAEGRMTL